MTAPKILEDLYNSEINWSIETNWDAGITFRLGDSYNGYSTEQCVTYDFDEGVAWLKQQAIKEYPDSKFTKQATDVR